MMPERILQSTGLCALNVTLNTFTHVLERDDRELLHALREVRSKLRSLALIRGPRQSDPGGLASALAVKRADGVHDLTRQVRRARKRLATLAHGANDHEIRDALLDAEQLWARLEELIPDLEGDPPVSPGSSEPPLELPEVRFLAEVPWRPWETWDPRQLRHYARRIATTWRVRTRLRRGISRLAADAAISPSETKELLVHQSLVLIPEGASTGKTIRIDREWKKRASGLARASNGPGPMAHAAARNDLLARVEQAEKPARLHVFDHLPPEEAWIWLRAAVVRAAKEILMDQVAELSDPRRRDLRPSQGGTPLEVDWPTDLHTGAPLEIAPQHPLDALEAYPEYDARERFAQLLGGERRHETRRTLELLRDELGESRGDVDSAISRVATRLGKTERAIRRTLSRLAKRHGTTG